MGFAGSQAADLMQCPLAGSYEFYLEREGGLYEQSPYSVNIPWLMGLSVSMGNAATSALAKNAVVFCEPEWGWDVSGGKDIGPGQQMAVVGGSGGAVVTW